MSLAQRVIQEAEEVGSLIRKLDERCEQNESNKLIDSARPSERFDLAPLLPKPRAQRPQRNCTPRRAPSTLPAPLSLEAIREESARMRKQILVERAHLRSNAARVTALSSGARGCSPRKVLNQDTDLVQRLRGDLYDTVREARRFMLMKALLQIHIGEVRHRHGYRK